MFEPETPADHWKYQKTRIVTSVKYYHLTVGAQGQGGLKVLYLRCHSQKTRTPLAKFFIFECRLEDLLRLLTFQPGP